MIRIRGRQLAGLAAGEALRFSGARIGLAFVYHRVAEHAGDRTRELNPAVASSVFSAQLQFLLRHHSVVFASDLYDAVSNRRRGEPIPVAVTFDDDLPEHLDVVRPILDWAGARATFFLCGTSLEQPFFHWWETLQTVVDARLIRPKDLPLLPEKSVTDALSGMPRAIHALALAIERLSPAERSNLEADLWRHAAGWQCRDRLSGAKVADLAKAGFEIGFHTRRHDVLVNLSADELDERLTEGRERLEDIASRPLTAVAYPHGQADAKVAEAAIRAGFSAGFTGVRTAATATGDPMLVGRFEAKAGDSLREFRLMIARGLLVAGRRVRAG